MNISTSSTIPRTNSERSIIADHFWRVMLEPYPRLPLATDILVANQDLVEEILTWPNRPNNVSRRLMLSVLFHSRKRLPKGSAAFRAVCFALAETLSRSLSSLRDGQASSSS